MPPLILELIAEINKHSSALLDEAEKNLAESEAILKAIGGDDE